jgi:predicted exporter
MLTTIAGRFRLWLAAMLALIAVFAMIVVPHFRVDTDILTLLPGDAHDPGAEQALRTYTEQLGRHTLFLVGARDLPSAKAAATAFAGSLTSSGAFAQARVDLDAAVIAGLRDYLPYRYGLLDDRHRSWLQQGETQRLYDEALRALYTPAGLMRPFGASDDPLGLLSAFVADQKPPSGRARPQDGVLAVVGSESSYVLVIADTSGSPFSAAVQQAAGPAITAAREAGHAAGATEIVGSGLILHAAEAARRAHAEMNIFSAVSLIGSVLLLVLTFRSLRPVLLGVTAMGFGAIAGLAACYAAFGNVHMLTLVFGSSLIGTAVDYVVYYFADGFRRPTPATAQETLRNVASGILLGYLTTALSYAALLIAPFPGLRQIALFSAVGLGVACACMLCLFPRFHAAPVAASAPSVPRFVHALAKWRWADMSRTARIVSTALVLIAVAGLAKLSFLDDVRALQSPSADLLNQELRVRELLGQSPDSRFFLVRGDSPEQVLQHEEALRARLNELRSHNQLGGLLALSSPLPSTQRQSADHALLASTVYGGNGLLRHFMQQLGYSEENIARAIEPAADEHPLTLDTFLGSAASEPYRAQWLGRVGDGYGSVVTLFDVRDIGALKEAASGLDGVRLVDKVADISSILKRYRELALGLSAAVYVIIGLLLVWRYGWRLGGLTLLPAVGAAMLAIALQAWLGIPVNLFNVLALLLILGMGVDYAIFLREARGALMPAIFAVCVATATAALSFGVLVFSSTPFIRSIGLTMALGISLASVLVIGLRPRSETL